MAHVLVAGVKQCGEAVAGVYRDDLVAQFVVRRVQRDGEAQVGHFAQGVDGGDDTGGAQGHAALGEAEGVVVHHQPGGGQDVVEVHQRLAHAHEDDVGHDAVVAVAVAVEDVFGKPHLDDNFAGGEVAVKARVASGAEGAGQGAACLRGDAEGAAVVFRDKDGFDAVAAVVAENPFACAVAGGFVGDDGREAQFGDVFQFFAQRFAEVGHRVKVGDALVVNPFQQLFGAEGFFAVVDEPRGHCLAVQIEQVDFVCHQRHSSRSAKKKAISHAAFSRLSEPCTALRPLSSAKSARSVPGAASFGSVAPMSVR